MFRDNNLYKNYNKLLIEINEDINKMIYYVYGLEDSILLRYQLFSNRFIDSTKSQSKS